MPKPIVLLNSLLRAKKNGFNESLVTYLASLAPVDYVEMKKFLGLTFLMDIVKLSTVNLYWFWEELYHHWIFSRSMTQNRFQIIMKFLHSNDNHVYDPNGENRDRLNKVWLLLEMIQERMRKVYTPGQHLSIDKLLVLYKGCRQFKQYIKNKCTRFGIELYELCISYGITLDRTVYCGKGMFTDNNPTQ